MKTRSLHEKFKIALVLSKTTTVDFAKKHSVTDMSIIRVLQGKSKSKKLKSAIKLFIDKTLPEELK